MVSFICILSCPTLRLGLQFVTLVDNFTAGFFVYLAATHHSAHIQLLLQSVRMVCPSIILGKPIGRVRSCLKERLFAASYRIFHFIAEWDYLLK